MNVSEIVHLILSVILGILIYSGVRPSLCEGFYVFARPFVLLISIVIASVILSVCGGFIVEIFKIAVLVITGGLE